MLYNGTRARPFSISLLCVYDENMPGEPTRRGVFAALRLCGLLRWLVTFWLERRNMPPLDGCFCLAALAISSEIIPLLRVSLARRWELTMSANRVRARL